MSPLWKVTFFPALSLAFASGLVAAYHPGVGLPDRPYADAVTTESASRGDAPPTVETWRETAIVRANPESEDNNVSPMKPPPPRRPNTPPGLAGKDPQPPGQVNRPSGAPPGQSNNSATRTSTATTLSRNTSPVVTSSSGPVVAGGTDGAPAVVLPNWFDEDEYYRLYPQAAAIRPSASR
jgi:hypothetical protein